MTGVSQVLSPLKDLQGTQAEGFQGIRLPPMRLPRKERLRFEVTHAFFLTTKPPPPSKDPDFSKPVFLKHKKPVDSPRSKRSLSPLHTRYATLASELQIEVPGSTKSRLREITIPVKSAGKRELHRKKQRSLVTGGKEDMGEGGKHLPAVVNLTYDGLRMGRKPGDRLRFKVLPIRKKRPRRAETPILDKRISLSPTRREDLPQHTGEEVADHNSSVDTPASVTPYLTPKMTRRVIFTKEAE